MNGTDREYLEFSFRPCPDVAASLSKREREIVTLISQGLTNQEIAQKMFLSINTVKTYIRTTYRRLGVASRSQAVIWGIRNEQRLAELVEPDSDLLGPATAGNAASVRAGRRAARET